MSNFELKRNNWQKILSLALSGLGILFFLILALSLAAIWLLNIINPQGSMDQTILYGLLVWSSILAILMLVPVFLLSFYELRGQAPPNWLDTSRPVFQKAALWSILLWPGIVAIGWLVAGSPLMAAFLLGPINVFVAGLPILWLYTSTTRALERDLQVRKWRIFGLSLTVTPFIIIILEILALLILGVFGLLYASYQASIDPSFEQGWMALYEQFSANQGDVEAFLEIIAPYIKQPGVIVWILVIFAGVVPIIEEMIKPIALWPLVGRKITPQQGFVGGLLCGAGFALMENVLYFSASLNAMDWISLAIGRAGTGILHMLASGLMGWGLAKVWRDGKWFFLGVMSLLAIILHGLWNAVALLSGIGSLVLLENEPNASQIALYNAPTWVLFIISVISMVLINRHFRKQNHPGSSDLEDKAADNGYDVV